MTTIITPTRVPSSASEYDEVLDEIARLITAKNTRLGRLERENRPEVELIARRKLDAENDLAQGDGRLKVLHALAYAYAKEHLPSAGQAGRTLNRPGGSAKLYTSGKPEVIILDANKLMAELRQKRLIRLFTVMKRVVSRDALIAHMEDAIKAGLKQVVFKKNEFFSITLPGDKTPALKDDTASLLVTLAKE